MNLGLRITLFTIIIVGCITTAAFFIFRPAIVDLLTQQSWCVDQIYYKSKLIGPKTEIAIYLRYNNGQIACFENAMFKKTGELSLPGINSSFINGKWTIEDDTLHLKTDTLQQIFNGSYSIKFSNSYNQIALKSGSTLIVGHIDRTAPDLPF